MRASMNCAQANTGSMLGIEENARTRITGNRALGPEQRERVDNGRGFSGIIGMDPGTCECKMSFGRDNWTKHDTYSSKGSSCDSDHLASVSLSAG